MTRVMITGGRDYRNVPRVYQILDAAVDRLGLSELIHGDCPTGADAIGAQWATDRGVKQTAMPADWDTHGAKAGPLRNQAMIDLLPDYVIGFPGGRGTRDALKRARRAGIEPILIDWEG